MTKDEMFAHCVERFERSFEASNGRRGWVSTVLRRMVPAIWDAATIEERKRCADICHKKIDELTKLKEECPSQVPALFGRLDVTHVLQEIEKGESKVD